MTHLELKLNGELAQKIQYLLSLYADKNIFFKNVINYEIKLLKNEILNFKIELKQFEEKYQISSVEFYKQYKNGKVDDSEDSLLWIGLYEMLLENEEKIKNLK